jgi:hypothetical protein
LERVDSLFKINFDYESVLYEDKTDLKINETFEHLFFFCSDRDDVLFTKKEYSADYLEYVKSATGFINKMSSSGQSQNWWGDLLDLDIERKVNSKLTSLEVSNLLSSNFSSSFEVSSIDKIELYLKELGEILIRSPFERSGRRNIILENLDNFEKYKSKIEELLKISSVIVDKYHHSRDYDLGSTYFENNGSFDISFQIKNLNDGNGVFRGGLLLKKNILSSRLDDIAKEFYNRGARGQLQIDSFRFKGEWNWLCEVNYRKTMGHVIKKLSRLCPPSFESALLVTPSSWLKKSSTHKELCHKLEELDGIFPLSPVNSPVQFWLVSAPNIKEMYDQILIWWSIVSKEGREFPSVFTKIIKD